MKPTPSARNVSLSPRLGSYSLAATASLIGTGAQAAIVTGSTPLTINTSSPSADFAFGIAGLEAFQFNFVETNSFVGSSEPVVFNNLDIFAKQAGAQWIGGTSVGTGVSGTVFGVHRLAAGAPVTVDNPEWNGWPKASAQGADPEVLYGNLAFFNPSATASQQGQFLGQSGFLGVRFQWNGNTHYGWIEADGNATATVLTISQWAYNDIPGEGILAGQPTAVPEPASWPVGLGLLALGAAGVTQYRRQRSCAKS